MNVDLNKDTIEELQHAHKLIMTELYKRFDERKEVCEHPQELRGILEVPRSSNHAYGCTYCLTYLSSELPLSSLIKMTTEETGGE